MSEITKIPYRCRRKDYARVIRRAPAIIVESPPVLDYFVSSSTIGRKRVAITEFDAGSNHFDFRRRLSYDHFRFTYSRRHFVFYALNFVRKYRTFA